MSRVYVGNLDPRVSERDLEDEFRVYGVLRRSVFVVVVPLGTYRAVEAFYETLMMRMGLKYMTYKVASNEILLYEEYRRRSTARDPNSVNAMCWEMMKREYLDGHNVRCDFGLLRKWLVRARHYVVSKNIEKDWKKESGSVWVARRPPGYAFIDFDDRRDAQDAIHALDGKNGWRVELSHNSRGGGSGGRGGGGGAGGGRGRDRSGGSDMKCYECGEAGHFARECRLRVGSGGAGSGRRRSRTPPRYRRSPSYGRRSYSPRDRSPRARRSYSPADRSPRSRSPSPRKRSYSKSPTHQRNRDESPVYANGKTGPKDVRRSRS